MRKFVLTKDEVRDLNEIKMGGIFKEERSLYIRTEDTDDYYLSAVDLFTGKEVHFPKDTEVIYIGHFWKYIDDEVKL